MPRSRLLLSWLVALAVGLAAVTPAPTAEAQSRAELARSRALFEQGLMHAQAGRWADARTSFEAALAITERPSILLNLATAQAETGALVAGAASYRRFLQIATARDRRDHGAEVEQALAALERRTPHLTLDTSALAPTDSIQLDGRALDRTDADPLALDPGAHRVVVVRAGRDLVDENLTLAESEARTLALRPPEPRPTRRVEAPVVVVEPEPTPSGGDDGLAIGLGVGISVGVVVIAGVVIGVVLGTSSPETYQGNLGSGVVRF